MRYKWWKDNKSAEAWIKQNKKREKSGDPLTNTTLQSQEMVIREIKKRKSFKSVLEIGAGDGRLIGNLSNESKKKCYSIDINEELNRYVKDNYPEVIVEGKSISITDMPFKDGTFDLVFTYQVLQHLPAEEVELAINEMIRVSKKEVWMWEGIGRVDYKHGDKSHNAHDGSYVWHINKFIKCYSVTVPTNKNISLDRQRLYKYKK